MRRNTEPKKFKVEMTEMAVKLLIAPRPVDIGNGVVCHIRLEGRMDMVFDLGHRTIVAVGCDGEIVDDLVEHIPKHFDEVFEYWREEDTDEEVYVIAEDCFL